MQCTHLFGQFRCFTVHRSIDIMYAMHASCMHACFWHCIVYDIHSCSWCIIQHSTLPNNGWKKCFDFNPKEPFSESSDLGRGPASHQDFERCQEQITIVGGCSQGELFQQFVLYFFYLKRFRSICNTIICQIAFVEQVDHLGSLLDDVRVVDDSINEFAKLLKSYNIKWSLIFAA